MIEQQHLDIRTITMGISLLDCCDEDADKACEKIYKERGFTAVNIKEISTATSFTRPAIYSYSGNVSISRILCRMRLCIS